MHDTGFELVQASDVVVVYVGRHRGERLVNQVRDFLAQGCDPEPGIDQQVPVSAANVPDIAAQKRVGVWLP